MKSRITIFMVVAALLSASTVMADTTTKTSASGCRKLSGSLEGYWGGIRNTSKTTPLLVECPISVPPDDRITYWTAMFNMVASLGPAQCDLVSVYFNKSGAIDGWVSSDSVDSGSGHAFAWDGDLSFPVHDYGAVYLWCSIPKTAGGVSSLQNYEVRTDS